MSEQTVEDYIKFIEMERRDEIGQYGLEVIAKVYKEMKKRVEDIEELKAKIVAINFMLSLAIRLENWDRVETISSLLGKLSDE
jgi:hypothetical protein